MSITNSPDEESGDTGKSPTTTQNDQTWSPRASIKKLSRTFSQDTTSSTATWHAGTALLAACAHEEDPPPHFEASFCSPGFALKLCQLTLCILCIGLFFEGSGLIYDFKQQLFPYIAYWTYVMITGVIIISYLLGQKMREILIRIYNIIGGIMFLIAAMIMFNVIAQKWECWTGSSENLEPRNSNMCGNPELTNLKITDYGTLEETNFNITETDIDTPQPAYFDITVNRNLKPANPNITDSGYLKSANPNITDSGNIQPTNANISAREKLMAHHKTPTKSAKMLITQSIICFLNSILYFFDTAYSLYLSYKSVTFHLQRNQ